MAGKRIFFINSIRFKRVIERITFGYVETEINRHPSKIIQSAKQQNKENLYAVSIESIYVETLTDYPRLAL